MSAEERLSRIADEHEIDSVLSAWAFARDCGDWDILSNCFQPDATINISWFSGPAADFVERSKGMLAEFKPGEHGKHQIGRARIKVEGDRATSECHVQLLRRVVGDPFDFDAITWGRFFDLFEKREDGVWCIHRRTMVYEKDRLDPVNPADVPAGFFEALDLSAFPPACQVLCYRLSLVGRAPMDNIVQVGSEAEAQLKKDAVDWLGRRTAV
jgi:hypothetical protein